MSKDYLWDRKGKPDPDVERLESLLGRFRYRPPARGAGRRRITVLLAVAASLVILATGLFVLTYRTPGRTAPEASYAVVSLKGQATILSPGSRSRDRAWAGDVIKTDEKSQARLHIGEIGEVILMEQTQVTLRDCGGKNHRIDLERGTIHASIRARPRLFQVGTPAAIAVDLGCVYDLTVDDSGNTILAVDTGRVSFEMQGRKVYVPGKARCRANPDKGPGIPHWEDSTDALKKAITALEEGPGEAAALLGACLKAARSNDTLTLWHLFAVADEAGRGAVFDRLSGLSPPPAGVTRQACVALDSKALQNWKSHLANGW